VGSEHAESDIRELVRRCLAGQQDAICELVRRFEQRVYSLCVRMLGQHQDAEDVAQETFHRAIRSLHRWDASREFEPWLFAIAGNRCRTALGRRARRPTPLPLVEGEAMGPMGMAGHDDLLEEIRLVLSNMREEYRRAFELFHEAELSYEEIAAALDRPIGTIKTWVHRARKELVDRLKKRQVLQENAHAMR
jgi:RNA polymerase sigma-70 factor (ECF subfamily)